MEYVRAGRLAGSLFGNMTESATCDVSVLSDEDGVWYGRVRMNGVTCDAWFTTFFMILTPPCRNACAQVKLLLSVLNAQETIDIVYLQWFQSIEDDWDKELQLRPLQWQR